MGFPPMSAASSRVRVADYLAFLGRISPEKRVDRAIEIAGRAGMKLRVAAKVDAADQKYFHESIRAIAYTAARRVCRRNRRAREVRFPRPGERLLFPIDWPEPFGLVMIEAMSCGTPCVAWRAGSVPEIINEGVNGFIVDSIDDAVAAVHRALRSTVMRSGRIPAAVLGGTHDARLPRLLYRRVGGTPPRQSCCLRPVSADPQIPEAEEVAQPLLHRRSRLAGR